MGSGLHWPFLNETTLFNLLLEQTIPNSTLKNVLIMAGAGAILTLPIWGPAAINGLVAGGPVLWDKLKQWVERGYMSPPGGGGVTYRIGNIVFGHGARRDIGIPLRQLYQAIAKHINVLDLRPGLGLV